MQKGELRRAIVALSHRVSELRDQRGLKQHELAELAGIATRYVQLIEAAAKAPSFAVLVSLACALEVSLSDLLAPSTQRPRRRRPGRPRRGP